MMIWAAICNELGWGERHDWWRTLPMHVALAAAVLWHLLLIVTEKERRFYALYALVNLPILYLSWVLALVIATRFPL
jgi:hypothetical protein